MILLAKLCFLDWLFFLAHGLTFYAEEPSANLAKLGVCRIVRCFAEKTSIADASRLETLSLYSHSLKSTSVLATVSDSHSSPGCYIQEKHLFKQFTPDFATIKVNISDETVCETGVLTCTVLYVNTKGESHSVDSVIQLGQKSSLGSDEELAKSYLKDAMATLGQLNDWLNREGIFSRRTGYLLQYTTCERPFTNLPREIITMPNEMKVLCDTKTEGGGWIVFQRREYNSTNESMNVDFNRIWADYSNGFGDLHGDFWLGNEKLHLLTSVNTYKLRIDLRLKSHDSYYIEYSSFRISNESDGYRLSLGVFEAGTLGNNLDYYRNQKFSTPDIDNDQWSKHCARILRQGWWFNACNISNLNGPFHNYTLNFIKWSKLGSAENPIVFTEMKIRQTTQGPH